MKRISLHTFKYTLRDIHQNTQNRKLCFVIGAGASYKSGIPTGGKLAERWFGEINERYSKIEIDTWIAETKLDTGDLAAHYGTIYRKRFENDKTSGYEFLIQAMRDAKPTFGHFVLAQILTKVAESCVLTTNFDSLIESSIYQYTDKTPLVCGHESLSGYARPSKIHPLIIKIHRDLLLAPMSDPDEINALNKGWKEPLNNIFSTHIPIVIGYGGNDGSLMDYFEKMNAPSNFFWCGLTGSQPSKRVKNLVEKNDGNFVEIDGFDQMMQELLWVFDEIKPVNEELETITKSRLVAMDKQLKEIDQENDISDKTTVKELSAFEYYLEAENEPDYEKRKSIYLEALAKFPDTAWLWNAFTYFMQWIKIDYTNLEQYYHKALSIDPNHLNNNVNYANFLVEIKKDFENAERYYLKALSINSEGALQNGNYANFLNDVKKDFDNAERYYLKALSSNADDINVYGNYANFLRNIKRNYDGAEEFYLKALSINPDDANCNCNYASFLTDIRKDYESSEKYYLKASSLDPNNANFNGNYAIFLGNIKKDYKGAEKYFLKALSILPNNAVFNGNYSQLLLITNRKDSATEYIEKAFRHNIGDNDLSLELWFYRFAHYHEWQQEAEIEIENLLQKGIQSIGWNLEENISVAIADGHPKPDKLKEFADRITKLRN